MLKFVVALVAFVAAMLLAWPIYTHYAMQLPDVHSSSVVGPSGRDLWWSFGGFFAGALTTLTMLAVVRIAAKIRGDEVWALPPALIAAVALGGIVFAGVMFSDIHARQYRRQARIDADVRERQEALNQQERERQDTKAAAYKHSWSDAEQLMAQLEPDSIATTIEAAEARSPRAVMYWLRDHFAAFVEEHPWSTLSEDNRAAFGAFARRLQESSVRKDDAEIANVLGLVIGAAHGLADTRGAIDECARLGVANCRDSVAALALYLCRNGSACLDGYEGLDFATLSKDIGGAARWSCTAATAMRDTELCAYVRGEKR